MPTKDHPLLYAAEVAADVNTQALKIPMSIPEVVRLSLAI
jgi:hypothetical protein